MTFYDRRDELEAELGDNWSLFGSDDISSLVSTEPSPAET
jgi:hypothetical protein